jgi:hypothetical protein
MIKAAIVGAMFLLPGGVFAQAAPSAPEAEVMAVVNAVFDGMRKVDSAMVRPLFHAKARMITVDSPSPGARIEESIEGFIQQVGRPRTEMFDERLSNVRRGRAGSIRAMSAPHADTTRAGQKTKKPSFPRASVTSKCLIWLVARARFELATFGL